MNAWWLAIRPKTLLASVGPVLLANALASQYTQIDTGVLFITLLCALSLQVTVNLANDLFDGLSGVDNALRVGPTRALHSGLMTPLQLKVGLVTSISLSVISGSFLIAHGGVIFLILGIASVIAALAYSAGPYPLASHALGEVAVFIFFGLISVLGSFYLQTLSIRIEAIIYACIVGLLNSALMLVNNIRDINSDKLADKITLAIKLGDRRARNTYKVLLITALSIHVFVNYQDLLVMLAPLIISLLLLPMLFNAISTYHGKEFNLLLAKTAKFGFVYCMTTSLALLMG